MGKKNGTRRGTRRQVMNGTADQTTGGLKKENLKYNKKRHIVSKIVSKQAKQKMANNLSMTLWLVATKAVTTGRSDVSGLFKPYPTKIKDDVRKHYEDLKRRRKRMKVSVKCVKNGQQ
jgi:hypothetical protein